VVEGDVGDAEGAVGVVAGAVAVAEGDVVQPAASPITAKVAAAPAIHLPFLLDSNRRTRGRLPEFPATGDPDVALEPGPAGRFSSGPVGSYSFMVALLLLGL
jgi:hypothetical protein